MDLWEQQLMNARPTVRPRQAYQIFTDEMNRYVHWAARRDCPRGLNLELGSLDTLTPAPSPHPCSMNQTELAPNVLQATWSALTPVEQMGYQNRAAQELQFFQVRLAFS